jgi:hypothetical protein
LVCCNKKKITLISIVYFLFINISNKNIHTINSVICPTNNQNFDSEYLDKKIDSKNVNDYKEVIYNSLFLNTKKYYVCSNKLELSEIVSKFIVYKQVFKSLNMLRLYPLTYCK